MLFKSEKWKLLSSIWLSATLRTIKSMEFSRPEYWGGSLSLSPGDLPNPGIKPALQVDSLPAEPQGKSKDTGVGSLSLLQGIFPTQELNQSFLHCRQILYQLSYQRIDNGKMMIFWDWVSGFQSRVQFLSYMGSEKLFSLSVPQVSHL